MDTRELILYLAQAKKHTPVKIYLKEKEAIDFAGIRVFGSTDKILFGDWEEIRPVLERNREKIADMVIENDRRNSGIPLLDTKDIPARIEPGAILRDSVSIGKNAVIMMGAILNIGVCVGEETMIDMGAVLGAQAKVGKRCHIGAGAVLAGVLEPPSAKPVIVEDEVLIGANAVVLEGVRIGKGSVIAAGAVVTENVEAGMVAAGMPARIIKSKDDGTVKKTGMIKELRCL